MLEREVKVITKMPNTENLIGISDMCNKRSLAPNEWLSELANNNHANTVRKFSVSFTYDHYSG